MNTKFLAVVFIFLIGNLKSQSFVDYVRNNSTSIDISKSPFEQLKHLDSAVSENRFFFFGDAHIFKVDVQIQWFFLEYLYEKANVRNYIIERSPGDTYALNQYVVEGDSTFFEYTTDYYVGVKEKKEFYKKVYEFNKKKPDNEKIKFFAFDVAVTNHVGYLKELIKQRKRQGISIKPMLDIIMSASEDMYKRKEYIQLLAEIKVDLSQKEVVYKDFFGEDFRRVKKIVMNVNNYKRSDANIFSSFKQSYNEGVFQKGNFVAVYGFGHTSLSNSKLLGGKINDFFKGKAMSFRPYYFDSYGKYGAEKSYHKTFGAAINGDNKGYRNNKFAIQAEKTSNVPIQLIDLIHLPEHIIKRNKLTGQFLIIFRKSKPFVE